MKVIIEEEKRDCFGVFELAVRIDDRRYTYFLSSEWALRKTKEAIRKREPGRAIQLLKQFNHKEIYEIA